MTFRSLPPSGDWPAWFPPTGASGVYLIRRAGAVVYVGESHTGRLRKTLAHHFQSWTGKTAGPTYPRQGTECAVIVTPDGKAVDRQNALIEQLRPRDNTAGKPEPRRYTRPAPSILTTAAEAFDNLNPF